jgi:ribonuclease G
LPEWLVERGIGETRAALVEDGRIIEARVELDDDIPAGTIIEARLTSVGTNGRNAVALSEVGIEYLLPRGTPQIAEGARISIEVTRAAIPGTEAWKRPLARLSDAEKRPLPPLADRLGGRVLQFPAQDDALAGAGWNDLIDEARTGIVKFRGGELRISSTPAMTLLDVDGYLPPPELAVAGSSEAASAIRRLDIGGSIGVDLPTSGNKAARQHAAGAIDALLPKPFERTSVNGFGFLQIVRPRLRASLLELAQDRSSFEARALLRRAAFEAPGRKRIVAHPSVVSLVETRKNWIDELSRQVGGAIELHSEATLPISGSYAQTI